MPSNADFILYYGVAGLLLIFFVVILSYLLFTGHQTSLLIKKHVRAPRANQLAVRIHLSEKWIRIDLKDYKKEGYLYPFDELKNHLSIQHLNNVNEWTHLANDEKLKKQDSISIYWEEPESPFAGWIRLKFIRVDKKNQTVVALGQRLMERSRDGKALDTSKFRDLQQFLNEVRDTVTSGNPRGTIWVFHLRHLAMYHRRYGIEVANHYMLSVWGDLQRATNHSVSYYFGGNFCLYTPLINSPKSIESFLETIIHQVPKEISVSHYNLDISFQVGTTAITPANQDLTQLLKETEKMARKAKPLSIPVTYETYTPEDKDNTVNNQEEALLQQLIVKSKIITHYYPIMSMHTGTPSGYLVRLQADKISAYSYEDLERLAREYHRIEEFFTMSLRAAILRFLRYKSNAQPLFILVKEDLLETARSFILSHSDFSAIKIVLIVENYLNLDTYFKQNSFKDFALSLVDTQIRLAFLAKDNMKTSFHPYFEYIQYVMFDQLIDGVEKSQLVQLLVHSIMQCFVTTKVTFIASQVTNFPQAEVLRDQGVMHLCGPLFGLIGKDMETVTFNRLIQKLLDVEDD